MTCFHSTAVVIIDVQQAILEGLGVDREKEMQTALDATVQRIGGLLARARSAAVPVIHVQHDGAPGHRLQPCRPGWAIRREVAPSEREIVVRKQSCDAFFETSLEVELSKRGVKRIVVAGCMTQYCIDTTVRRAVSLGYDVTLAADGHMTAGANGLRFEQIVAHHNATLDGFDAGSHIVQVCSAAEIQF
jgi:nicotinamidase-related amidase